jgi:hypothetical protein
MYTVQSNLEKRKSHTFRRTRQRPHTRNCFTPFYDAD